MDSEAVDHLNCGQSKALPRPWRYVALDMDGVLLPFESTWLSAAKGLLMDLGLQVDLPTLASSLNEEGGSNVAATVARLCARNQRVVSQSDIELQLRERVGYLGDVLDTVSLAIARHLRELASAGILLAIVSSRLNAEIRQAVERLELERSVSVIIGRDDVPRTERKPSAGQLKLARKRLHVSSASGVYLGDMRDDLIAAHRDRTDAVWVRSEYVPSGLALQLESLSCEAIRRNDLPDWLSSRSSGFGSVQLSV